MLGLKRRTVRVVDHRPEWAGEFERVAAEIAAATGLGRDSIAHVGSTAIPSLIAKPILDVAISAAGGFETDRVAEAIVQLGYIDRGQGEGSIGRLLVFESVPDIRTIHIHIVDESEPWWANYHRFLRILRTDSQVRERYAELKRELAERYPLDRATYVKGKADFITEVLRREGDGSRQGAP